MVKMTLKERTNTKAQKMTDLILDSIPKEGGEKSLDTEFYDYRDGFKYELSISIKKSLIVDDIPMTEDGTIIYDDDGTPHIYNSDGEEILDEDNL